MADLGLRERKKRQTRQLIADAAARLFARRGYENVAVIDVAAAAEVSEQTVYNYFPTKKDLVLDREEDLRDHLTGLISARPAGTTVAPKTIRGRHDGSRNAASTRRASSGVASTQPSANTSSVSRTGVIGSPRIT